MPQLLSELEHWYPGILAVIVNLWGTNDLNNYLNNLIMLDRNDREGFPEVVMSELLLICMINLENTSSPETNIWKNRT